MLKPKNTILKCLLRLCNSATWPECWCTVVNHFQWLTLLTCVSLENHHWLIHSWITDSFTSCVAISWLLTSNHTRPGVQHGHYNLTPHCYSVSRCAHTSAVCCCSRLHLPNLLFQQTWLCTLRCSILWLKLQRDSVSNQIPIVFTLFLSIFTLKDNVFVVLHVKLSLFGQHAKQFLIYIANTGFVYLTSSFPKINHRGGPKMNLDCHTYEDTLDLIFHRPRRL